MGRVTGALAMLGAVRGGYAGLLRKPPGEMVHWERRNHAKKVVTILQGTAVAAGSVLVPLSDPRWRGRVRGGVAAGAAVAAAAGTVRDFTGAAELAKAPVPPEAVRAAGIGLAGLLVGLLVRDRAVDGLLAGAVVAGTVYAVDAVDRRPGRAAKAVAVAAAPDLLRSGEAGALAAAAVAGAVAVLPEELAEETMLGHGGAMALGTLVGSAWVVNTGRGGLLLRAGLLAALLPVLERDWPEWADEWGRAPR